VPDVRDARLEAALALASAALKAVRLAMKPSQSDLVKHELGKMLDELEGQFDRIAPPQASTRARLRLLP
jgi:hypothetical protein